MIASLSELVEAAKRAEYAAQVAFVTQRDLFEAEERYFKDYMAAKEKTNAAVQVYEKAKREVQTYWEAVQEALRKAEFRDPVVDLTSHD